VNDEWANGLVAEQFPEMGNCPSEAFLECGLRRPFQHVVSRRCRGSSSRRANHSAKVHPCVFRQGSRIKKAPAGNRGLRWSDPDGAFANRSGIADHDTT
jgi:hypothetical protein